MFNCQGAKKTISKTEWQELLDAVDLKTTYVNPFIFEYCVSVSHDFLFLQEPQQSGNELFGHRRLQGVSYDC